MKPEQSDQTQRQRFEDLARELEADEDESHFKDQVRRIAKAPPQKTDAPSDD